MNLLKSYYSKKCRACFVLPDFDSATGQATYVIVYLESKLNSSTSRQFERCRIVHVAPKRNQLWVVRYT